MPTNPPNSDAQTAAEFAAAAKKHLIHSPEWAAAEASLATYHQLRAADSGEQVMALKMLAKQLSQLPS